MVVISRDVQLLQEFLSTGNQINILLSTYPIMFGFMNIIFVSLLKTHKIHVIYSFNKIMKFIFINSYLLNLIPCEPGFTSTPFYDTSVLTYKIELPLSGKKVGFNILDDEDFTISYITDTIPNSPSINQPSTQAKRNVCIIAINVKEPIIYQGALDELNCHKTPRGNLRSISVYEEGRTTI